LRGAVRSDRFSWEETIRLASEHLVAPAVHRAALEADIAATIPADVVDYFEGVATLNRQRNAAIRDEAIDLGRILNAAGIVPVFLKGGANLLSNLYADTATRVMSDLDILVSAAQAGIAIEALRDSGFVELSDYQDPRAHHHAPLGRNGAPAMVELHHAVLAYPFGSILTADEVLESAQRLPIGEEPAVDVAVPTIHHRIVHNIAHAQLMDHGYVYGTFDLRQLLDFVLLCLAAPNETDWLDIESRFRSRAALEFHLLAAARWLHFEAPIVGRPRPTSRFLFARAGWQVDRPRLAKTGERLLRPWLLLACALSDDALRRRLAGNLVSPAWHRRQLRMLRGLPPE
jgi:hypothetical protein